MSVGGGKKDRVSQAPLGEGEEGNFGEFGFHPFYRPCLWLGDALAGCDGRLSDAYCCIYI